MAEVHSTWQLRLKAEYEDLTGRIENLKSFLNTNVPKEIDPRQLKLLRLQLHAMEKYQGFLKQRLDLLEE